MHRLSTWVTSLTRIKGKRPRTISYNLRRELIDKIDNEKRAVCGPVLKSRDELIETTLRDTYMVKLMEDMASTEGKDYRVVSRVAKKYLDEDRQQITTRSTSIS